MVLNALSGICDRVSLTSLHAGAAVLKTWAKKILLRSGGLKAAARLRPPGAVILAYHSVRESVAQDEAWIGPGITHTRKVFERQMELVARQFHPVTFDDILLFVRGEKKLPSRAVAITFDDGYVDNLEIAAPVLQRLGMTAAFYVTVGLIDSADAPWFARIRRAFMTSTCKTWHSAAYDKNWDISTPSARDAALLAAYDAHASLVEPAQSAAVRSLERELEVDAALPPRRLMLTAAEVSALRRAGHVVGSHTLTHPNVAHVQTSAVLDAELAESKRRLEQILGEPVRHFSYPHPALRPQWNTQTVTATRQAGYISAVTTTKGPVGIGSDPLTLSRVNAPRPEHEFLLNLERAFLRRRQTSALASPDSQMCS